MAFYSPLIQTFRILEATIGAFFAFAVGFCLTVFGGFVLFEARHRDREFVAAVIAWGIAVILESIFLYRLKVSLEEGESSSEDNRYPFAPRFAIELGHWPIVLRPLAAIWWLAHFALAVAVCVMLDSTIMNAVLPNWGRAMLFVGVNFTVAYSANLFALLTVTALGGGERLVRRLWPWRFALDLSVAIATASGLRGFR